MTVQSRGRSSAERWANDSKVIHKRTWRGTESNAKSWPIALKKSSGFGSLWHRLGYGRVEYLSFGLSTVWLGPLVLGWRIRPTRPVAGLILEPTWRVSGGSGRWRRGDSSLAPLCPRSRSRSSFMIVLRWAKSISTFLRLSRDAATRACLRAVGRHRVRFRARFSRPCA